MRRELIQVSLPSTSPAASTKACFADLESGTVGDLVKTLLVEDGPDIAQELGCEVDGDSDNKLDSRKWGLQRVTLSEPNRRWSDEELLALDQVTAILDMDTPLSTVLPTKDDEDTRTSGNNNKGQRPPSRNFSDFTLTAHLQVPLIRLVYLPFAIEITLTHVPEIPEEFRLMWYVGGHSTVAQVLDSVLDKLGIRKIVTQGSKSARVEYTIKVNDEALEPTVLLLPYLQQAQTDTEKFRVCLSISDVWHARIGTVAKSFSKALQRPPLGTVTARRRREDSPGYSTSTTPSAWRPASIFSSLWQSPTSNVGDDSQDTIRAGQHSDGEEEEEGEGTLKGLEPNAAKAPPSARSVVPSRGNTRLSSLFDAWSYSTHSPEATESKESLKSSIGRNRMVSEPMAMDDFRRASMLNLDTILLDAKKQDAEDAALVGIDVQFENMMDQLGIKENQRQAMRMMDDQRKRFLIQQQQQKTGSAVQQVQSHKSGLARTSSNRQSASNNTPPTSALAGLTRFSLWSAGTDSSASEPNSRPQSPEAPRSPGISDTASVLSFVSQDTEVHTPPAPLLQTATGWSSWFSAGSPAKPSIALTDQSGTSNAKDTPSFYITQIMNGKLARPNLVKHLIALRVRLSTAALSWITDFLQNDGLAALEKILRTFTSRTTTATGRDSLTELNASLQIETIRCLRIILNTENGFEQVLAKPSIVTQVTFSLQTQSNKLRALAADVLAAVCVLSTSEGHKLVVDAFSDFRVVYTESARFESLILSISVNDEEDGQPQEEVDDASLWEYRAAGMALINAIVNSPERLDERILLRDEFARRGLNETMTALRYISPPDALATQLAVYIEEKQEDQEEFQERHLGEKPSTTKLLDAELVDLISENPRLGSELRTMANFLVVLLASGNAETSIQQALALIRLFVQQLCVDRPAQNWLDSISDFLAEAEPMLGRLALVTSTRARETADVPSSFLEDLLALRKRVEELSDERDSLMSRLDDKIATGNTVQALSPRHPTEMASQESDAKEGMPGVIQRLVAKEKEVLQLQKDIAALQASKGRVEDADAARKERAERNRQWANLMEEISRNKAQLAEFEVQIEARNKEIKYLQRALESVYTRFQTYRDEIETTTVPPSAEATVMDVTAMTTRTLEALAERDRRIAELTEQLKGIRPSTLAGLRIETPTTRADESLPSTRSPPTSTAVPIPGGRAAVPPPPPPPPPPLRNASTPAAAVASQPESISNGKVAKLSGFGDIKVVRQAPQPPGQAHPAVSTTTPTIAANVGAAKSVPPPPPLPPQRMVSTERSGLPGKQALVAAPPPPPVPAGASSSARVPPPPGPPPLLRPVIKVSAPAVRAKLKPFFWNKIAATAANDTVWCSIQEDEDLDLTELVKDFAADTKIAAKSPPSIQSRVTSLLHLQRAQNIAIMLARLRLEHSAIRDAVLQVDDRKMTIDRLKPLKTFVPTAQEVTLLTGYTGDFSKLSQSDQYMRTMMSVPRLEERLTCMITRRRFEMDLEEIRPELSILRNAADEVRNSVKFKSVLKTVRAIGNALNASTFRGNARGFQLEALLKLRDTRATTVSSSATTSTLLHYVVRALRKQDESLIQFLAESPHVHAAARMSASNLNSSISTLNQAIEFVKEELAFVRQWPSAHPLDRFQMVMEVFIAESEPAMVALNAMSQQLEQDLGDLLRFFGEDPSSSKPEDFFGIISSFAIALQKADDEIRDAEKLAVKGVKASKRIVDGKRSIGRGQFDEALRDLRSGTGIRRARQEASVYRPRSRIMLDGARR